MLIDSDKLLTEIERIEKDLITDYKKKYYRDIWVAEINLLNRIKKEITCN